MKIFLHPRFFFDIRFILVFSFLLFNAFTSGYASKKQTFEAESARLSGGSSKVVAKSASGGFCVSLTKPGEEIQFTGLQSAKKLAIRYTSSGVGVINVAVNNLPVQKLNIHSSGSLTDFFLNAITYIGIPANSTVVISLASNDINVNIDQMLASRIRVLRITNDKGWINDDDPGTRAPGWTRHCNLGTGDYNNDLTTSNNPGDIWSCSFTGRNLSVVAPKEKGAGMIEVQIDGKSLGKTDLSANGIHKPQQIVFNKNDLTPGKHVINIINCGPGPVAVDAIIVR